MSDHETRTTETSTMHAAVVQPDHELANAERSEVAQGGTQTPDRRRRQAIDRGVMRLLERICGHEERRWQPRVMFVCPVSITCEATGPQTGQSRQVLPGVTTDISLGGAGILTWRKLTAQFLDLKFPGMQFRCEVRWSHRLSGELYRYGLRFCDLTETG